MRWRGVRVSPRDGQTGSQKPHSMHLSTISSAAGSSEVLQVALRVVAEDHTRVEDAARVEQALELPHQAIGVLAPLQFDERRHVAPGAMLGLQRAAVLHRHQVRHVVHERRVAGDLLGRVEALGEDEVQVALQRVAEEDRLIVAVLVEQLDQAVDSLGQSFDGEGDVLDDHRGAGLAHRTDSREGVLRMRQSWL